MEQHSVECTYPRNPCVCKLASSEIAPLSLEEYKRRYRQRFIDQANLSEKSADECLNAALESWDDTIAHYENDPEGAADMEMSYWED